MAEQPRPSRLVWEKPDGSRLDFPLEARPLVVGRDDDADIRVNGEVVYERELRHGDEVRFARAKCRFLVDGGNDPVAGGV